MVFVYYSPIVWFLWLLPCSSLTSLISLVNLSFSIEVDFFLIFPFIVQLLLEYGLPALSTVLHRPRQLLKQSSNTFAEAHLTISPYSVSYVSCAMHPHVVKLRQTSNSSAFVITSRYASSSLSIVLLKLTASFRLVHTFIKRLYFIAHWLHLLQA